MAEDSSSKTDKEPAGKGSGAKASADGSTQALDGGSPDGDQGGDSPWWRGLKFFSRSGPGRADPPAKPKHGQHLDGLISDAKALVHYAVRHGQNVSEENIETLTLAIEAYGTDKWTQKTEVGFFKAFRRMSKALHPASVDSIKATISPSGGSSIARRAVLTYTFWTIVILLLLISVQIYWIVGQNITARITGLQSETTKIEATIKELNDQSGFFSENAQERMDQISILFLHLEEAFDFDAGGDMPTKIADGQARIRDLTPDDIERTIVPLFERIDQLSTERKQLLEKSDKLLLEVEHRVRAYQEISEDITAEYVLLKAWGIDWSLLLEWAPKFMELPRAENAELYDARSDELSLSSAKLTLKSLSSYILPLLYGLLGAYAYILRSLTKQIQRVTFSADSLVAFRLRWPLGMLAGISVGWFFGPETLPAGLSALQPLAVAFLAGYSVELLFTAMDKLIGAFTASDSPKPARA